MRTWIWLSVMVLTGGVCAIAEVADSAANGFTIKSTVNMQAVPADVYQAILQVGDWWDPAHTFSGDARNLSIDAKAMGCWCEKMPAGGAVRHMEVLTVMPGKTLVFSGGIGPLQSLGVAGSMKFQLTAAEGGTKLDFSYAVGGYLAAGLNTLAPIVDRVLGEQLARLKGYVERGRAAGK